MKKSIFFLIVIVFINSCTSKIERDILPSDNNVRLIDENISAYSTYNVNLYNFSNEIELLKIAEFPKNKFINHTCSECSMIKWMKFSKLSIQEQKNIKLFIQPDYKDEIIDSFIMNFDKSQNKILFSAYYKKHKISTGASELGSIGEFYNDYWLMYFMDIDTKLIYELEYRSNM